MKIEQIAKKKQNIYLLAPKSPTVLSGKRAQLVNCFMYTCDKLRKERRDMVTTREVTIALDTVAPYKDNFIS